MFHLSGGKPVNIRIWDTTNKAWGKWDGVLSTGDLAIGAVEIKDHDGSDRAAVTSNNELKVIDSSTITTLGEVQATPTSYTVLDRLKDISDGQLADGHNVIVNNAIGSAVYVQPGTAASFAVTGTFWQSTQPISNASLDGAGAPDIDSYAHLAINLNAGADQLLVSSAANKQIWVYGVSFTLSVAGTVSFQDEDNTAATGIMDFAANSGLSHPPSGNFSIPIWKLATDKDLEVDVVDAAIDGWLDYAIVSV